MITRTFDFLNTMPTFHNLSQMRLSILLLLIPTLCLSQTKPASEFGFRHFQTTFRSDTVDILVKSKKGEEEVKKLSFSFVKGVFHSP